MELTERLRKAIDAEEARLHALPPFPWKLNPDDDTEVFAADDVVLAEAWALSSNQQRLVAQHIVAGSPERGLRRCAADRKILDLHAPREYRIAGRPSVLQCEHCASLCHSGSGLACDSPDAPYPCETVQIVAEAYGGEEQA